MAWFKVDDTLYSHPKWLALPKGARALWVTAGAWSAAQLTDGAVPRSVLRLLDGVPAEARQLVEAGLWVDHEDGWRFHDWATYQPSRESVLKRRDDEARRKAEWRAKKAQKGGLGVVDS